MSRSDIPESDDARIVAGVYFMYSGCVEGIEMQVLCSTLPNNALFVLARIISVSSEEGLFEPET